MLFCAFLLFVFNAHTFLWQLILPQALEYRLPKFSGFVLFHIFDRTAKRRNHPYRILVSVRRRKRRYIEPRQLPYSVEALTANAKCHMSLVCQCSAYILSEQDACHTVFLRKITADDVVRVLEVLALNPVLRAFFEIVAAVLPFCYDTLQIFCLSKLKKSDARCSPPPSIPQSGRILL